MSHADNIPCTMLKRNTTKISANIKTIISSLLATVSQTDQKPNYKNYKSRTHLTRLSFFPFLFWHLPDTPLKLTWRHCPYCPGMLLISQVRMLGVWFVFLQAFWHSSFRPIIGLHPKKCFLFSSPRCTLHLCRALTFVRKEVFDQSFERN